MLFPSSIVTDFFESVDRPHRGKEMGVLGKYENSFFISSARSSTELDGGGGLPQAYLSQCRQ